MPKAKKDKQNKTAEKKTYFERLEDHHLRRRYLEKTRFIGGIDPFELPRNKMLPISRDSGENNELLPELTYIDMVNYFVYGKAPLYTDIEFKNYKTMQSYERFVTGWVQKVELLIHKIDGGDGLGEMVSIVRSKVAHSQCVSEKSLTCWIIIRESGSIESCHCECLAGSAESCSHVGAVCFYIEFIVRVREKRTVTQDPAYWLLPPAMKKIDYAPLKDIDFTSSKTMKT